MAATPARPLRILLAKLGLDTHTVGITVVAHALREAGMEVIFAGLKQTPEMVVNAAIQEDVDVVGISSLSAGHTRSLPRLARLLREKGGADKLLIVGGVIPEEDRPLYESLDEEGRARGKEQVIAELMAAAGRRIRNVHPSAFALLLQMISPSCAWMIP